jgi:hypothetical protein
METHPARMAEYVDRARALASRLQVIPGVVVQPGRPHTNAFQIWMPGDPEDLAERHRRFANDRGIWFFDVFHRTALDGHVMAEIAIGDASDAYSIDEAAGLLHDFVVGP